MSCGVLPYINFLTYLLKLTLFSMHPSHQSRTICRVVAARICTGCSFTTCWQWSGHVAVTKPSLIYYCYRDRRVK